MVFFNKKRRPQGLGSLSDRFRSMNGLEFFGDVGQDLASAVLVVRAGGFGAEVSHLAISALVSNF